MKLSLAIALLCALVAFAKADFDLISDNRLERLVDEILNDLEASADEDFAGNCGTANGYPICCPGRWIDPDGDGWGWQDDSYSCRVVAGKSGKPKGGGGGASSGGASSGGQCPSNVSGPKGIRCGCEIVKGLGANKQAYLKAGATSEFLASALMETRNLNPKGYAFGDNKSHDSFNAGACKMNWFMMRNCHPAWKNKGPSDYKLSAKLNSDKALDVKVYKECRKKFGAAWIKGHRGGETGLNNPMSKDVKRFQQAHEWTKKMLDAHPETKKNDVRFWCDIYAI